MNPALVIDMGQQAMILMLLLCGPTLLAGLFVGLIISVFQAITQINEMTLTFIPKIVAIVAVMLLTLPWMIMKMSSYTIALFNQIPMFIK